MIYKDEEKVIKQNEKASIKSKAYEPKRIFRDGIAERILDLREKRGIDRKDLVKALDERIGFESNKPFINLSGNNGKDTIAQLENPTSLNNQIGRKPSLELLVEIARYYNVSTDYILGLSDNEREEFKDVKEITGLSDTAIQRISYLRDSKIKSEILNHLFENGEINYLVNEIFSSINALVIRDMIRKENETEDDAEDDIETNTIVEVVDVINYRFANKATEIFMRASEKIIIRHFDYLKENLRNVMIELHKKNTETYEGSLEVIDDIFKIFNRAHENEVTDDDLYDYHKKESERLIRNTQNANNGIYEFE